MPHEKDAEGIHGTTHVLASTPLGLGSEARVAEVLTSFEVAPLGQ
ncbi:MAG: hypothetical protein OXB95_03235 [Rhodobacteraceae bacterium]|nr:hypothetical protein [Paracoccaceae bacterium]